MEIRDELLDKLSALYDELLSDQRRQAERLKELIVTLERLDDYQTRAFLRTFGFPI
jgi:vacuolar-type H+-ATPase subunit H